MPLTPSDCAVCLSRDGYSCQAAADEDRDASLFECAVCGTFTASRNALQDWLRPDHPRMTPIVRATLSHRIRIANDAGRQPDMLLTNTLQEFVESKPQLPSPGQQAINAIRYIGDSVSQLGQPLQTLPPSFQATIGSASRAFAIGLVQELKLRGDVSGFTVPDANSPPTMQDVALTLSGWDTYEKEKHGEHAGGYGFIALKFGDEVLDPLIRDHIKPALESIGYPAVDLRDVSRAGVIDNLLRIQIRDASFVLVDLTHENAGAYWEAGFAEGLGKPVLYICERAKFEEKKTHFDTNHCTTVLWDASTIPEFIEDLKATLKRSLNI